MLVIGVSTNISHLLETLVKSCLTAKLPFSNRLKRYINMIMIKLLVRRGVKSALMLTPHKTILILTNRWKYFMSIDFSCSKHMLHVIKFTCMPMLPILTSKLGCVKKYARGQAIFASLLKLFLQEISIHLLSHCLLWGYK